MQKELIYDKMNGFLTDGLHSLPEGIELRMNLQRGRSAAFCMKVYTKECRICANGWERTRVVTWKPS